MTVRKTAMRAAGLLVLSAMVAACGGGTAPAAAPSVSPATGSTSGSPPGSAPSRASQDSQNQGSQNQDQGSGQAVSSAGSSRALPRYQPLTVVNQSPHHLQLRSSASVADITAFYRKALDTGGWKVSVSVQQSEVGKFVAWRGGQGTTVVINTAGPVGTMISVSTYQRG